MTRKINTIYLLCIACAFSVLISCEEENGFKSGQLIGFTGLVDINNQEMTDRSGVEITLDNGSSKITAQTDNSGKFSFDDLEAGTYNVVYRKEGFYEHIIQGYGFAGGKKTASLYQVYLFSIHEAEIDSLRFLDFDIYLNSNQLEAYATISNDNQEVHSYFIYYISNTPDVSYKNYLRYENFGYFKEREYHATVYVDPILFPAGSTLYMIMYPSTENNYGVYKTLGQYLDLETGQKILTCVNKNMPSNVASFVVPEKINK